MEPIIILNLIAALLIKHFFCDFIIQTNYQIQNKGTYGHPGGLLHAFLHGLGTLLAFYFTYHITTFVMICILIEMGVHYHLDWAKMNIETKLNLTVADAKYWWLFGTDQLLHLLSVLVIVYLVVV